MREIQTVRSLAKELCKALPGFQTKGRLLFAQPLGYLIRGICLEASSSKNSFYLNIFVQPLYKDVDYIFFTFGGRVPGSVGWGWTLTPENGEDLLREVIDTVRTVGLPFLELIKDPMDLALACENRLPAVPDYFNWIPDDINVLESAAYSWILARNRRKAIESLRKIVREIEADDDDREWVLRLQSRTQTILKMLENGDDGAVKEQLDQWAVRCARSLRIEQFLSLPDHP